MNAVTFLVDILFIAVVVFSNLVLPLYYVQRVSSILCTHDWRAICPRTRIGCSAAAFAGTLRLNTVLRGLSLARNRLTAASAEAFGLLLAGGYAILPEDLAKRAKAEASIAAHNKIAADALKKKKDAQVETRLLLSTVTVAEDGRKIAGGSRSLAALNLSDNRELGAGGALAGLLMRIVDYRKKEEGTGGGSGAIVLQELHLARCCECGEDEEESGSQAGLIAAASFALRPTKVSV